MPVANQAAVAAVQAQAANSGGWGQPGASGEFAMPQPPQLNENGEKIFKCWYCNKTFGRQFILKRHEKMHTRGVSADPEAPTAGRRKKAKSACTNCQASKQACDDAETCEFCQRRGLVCERVAKPSKKRPSDADQPPASPGGGCPPPPLHTRRKPSTHTHTTPPALALNLNIPAWQRGLLTTDEDDEWDASEATTLTHRTMPDDMMSSVSSELGGDTGYLSDALPESSHDAQMGMGGLMLDPAFMVAAEQPAPEYAPNALVDSFLKASPRAARRRGGGGSSASAPLSPSVIEADMMECDEEIDEEEEAERLREQEQQLLLEQEEMLAREEEERLEEQRQFLLSQMQHSQP